MLKEFTEYLQEFNWSKLFISILLVAVAVAGMSLYESYTQKINLHRVKASLEIASLAENFNKQIGNQPSPIQKSIYDGALRTADSTINFMQETIRFQHSTMKFLAGLFPWLLMAFVYIGDKSMGSYIGMFGAVIIGIGTAGLLAIIPDIAWPWVNLAVLPVIPFVSILWIFAFISRQKQMPRK